MAQIIATFNDLKLIISTHGWASLYSRSLRKRRKKEEILSNNGVTIIRNLSPNWIERAFARYSECFDNDEYFAEWNEEDPCYLCKPISIEKARDALEYLYKYKQLNRFLMELHFKERDLLKIPQIKK
jgi:hypothetical protein